MAGTNPNAEAGMDHEYDHQRGCHAEKDPEAQKLLQLCSTRMLNQNVSIGDARDILEFMRQNDGE